MLGLPDAIRACLFDLDGVLTRTATLHAAAWKQMFDAYLHEQDPGAEPFTDHDYAEYVDGKPRDDGTRDFLASRGLHPDDATVEALGTKKNQLFNQQVAAGKVETFDTSIDYVRQVRAAGMRTAVVSSSANCQQVLASVGIEDLFDARIDGVVAKQRHLPGKPKPDTFLAGAQALGVEPSSGAVFEDALAGVEAGRAGGFGYVVGVDRIGQREALARHGADVVVSDLADLAAGAGGPQ